jgi:hypothetical protein
MRTRAFRRAVSRTSSTRSRLRRRRAPRARALRVERGEVVGVHAGDARSLRLLARLADALPLPAPSGRALELAADVERARSAWRDAGLPVGRSLVHRSARGHGLLPRRGLRARRHRRASRSAARCDRVLDPPGRDRSRGRAPRLSQRRTRGARARHRVRSGPRALRARLDAPRADRSLPRLRSRGHARPARRSSTGARCRPGSRTSSTPAARSTRCRSRLATSADGSRSDPRPSARARPARRAAIRGSSFPRAGRRTPPPSSGPAAERARRAREHAARRAGDLEAEGACTPAA